MAANHPPARLAAALAVALAVAGAWLTPGSDGCCRSLLAATCSGADVCGACKNCKYCFKCNKGKGACGKCKNRAVVPYVRRPPEPSTSIVGPPRPPE